MQFCRALDPPSTIYSHCSAFLLFMSLGLWLGHLRLYYLISVHLNCRVSVLTGGVTANGFWSKAMAKLMYMPSVNGVCTIVSVCWHPQLYYCSCVFWHKSICVQFVCTYSCLCMYCCDLTAPLVGKFHDIMNFELWCGNKFVQLIKSMPNKYCYVGNIWWVLTVISQDSPDVIIFV